MKKTLIFSLLFVVLLSGCASVNDSDNINNNTDAKTKNRMPDFERPENDPQVRGLVTSITSNEVTILELSMPNFEKQGEQDGNSEEGEQAPVAGFGSSGGAGMGGGMRGGQKPDMDDSERLEMIKSRSTGESKLLIPVGIKMLKNSDGEMQEAKLSDISVDSMLMVWIDESISDRKVAEFVVIN